MISLYKGNVMVENPIKITEYKKENSEKKNNTTYSN